MTIRQEMLAAAARAGNLLGESADGVGAFLRSRLSPDGGFRGRSGAADLYYTVFGIESLLAISQEVPAGTVGRYLCSFSAGESLDLVHLACLVRCWASLPGEQLPAAVRPQTVAHLEQFRSADGSYGPASGADFGTAYACFLTLQAYQDLEIPCPQAADIAQCVQNLAAPGGGYANQRHLAVGATASTAAAVITLKQLNRPVQPATAGWLLAQCQDGGGFVAVPRAPCADLLSTATGLHALAAMGVPVDRIRNRCIDFIMSLRQGSGGFRGCADDEVADCEYTYYALLALGHLSGQ